MTMLKRTIIPVIDMTPVVDILVTEARIEEMAKDTVRKKRSYTNQYWEGGGIHQHSNKKQSGDLQSPFPGELICNLENVAINHHRLLLMEHGL